MTETVTTTQTVPAAYADEADRVEVATLVQRLKDEAGWSRPMLVQATGFVPGAVWRAEKGKVHLREVQTWNDFFAKVASGELVPDVKPRKVKPAEALERMQRAADVLGGHTEAKGVKALRNLIEAALTELPAPTALNADADADDPTSDDDAGEQTSEQGDAPSA